LSSALATPQCRKQNKPLTLPVTADLIKLKDYQEEQIAELTAELQHMAQTFQRCAVSTDYFNKRRGGEAA